jgi:hypothetical protein
MKKHEGVFLNLLWIKFSMKSNYSVVLTCLDSIYQATYELTESRNSNVIPLSVVSVTPSINYNRSHIVQFVAELKLVHFYVILAPVAAGASGLLVSNAGIQLICGLPRSACLFPLSQVRYNDKSSPA